MEIYGAYRSNVARIRDAVAENKTQMRQVDQSLGMFQSGLLCVEREMLPIYKLTERLRETQKNIDLCVQELRKINENFIAAHELSPTLTNGSKFGQDEYVKALQKLLVAIAFLENHKSYEGSTKALNQAKELLTQARKKCKADFASAVGVLSRGSRDESNNNMVVWSAPSKKETAKVAQLLHCLLSSSIDQTELLTEYGKQRFQVVKMVLCEESSLVNSIGFYPATEAIGELTKHLKNIGVSISAEKTLAETIFPNEELLHAAFRYAAYPILDALKSDVDAAFSQISSTPTAAGAGTANGKKQLDPFKLLRLHELFVTRVRDFEVLISPPLLLRDRKGIGRDDPWVLSTAFTSIVSNVAIVAKQKLFGFQFELTDHIGVSDRSLSKDGNMLSFLRQLCEHTKPLAVLLQHDSNMTPTSFIDTVVMQFVESLQSKSAQFKGRNDLKQLFLANNFGHIANSLPHCAQKGGEQQAIEVYIQSEIKPRILELRDNAIAQFVDVSYASFQTFLVEPKEKLVYARGSDLLTLESGRFLKEKFARFNTQLGDIYKTQKHFIVSEPQIRHQIIQAAVDAIIPHYTKFYEKCVSFYMSLFPLAWSSLTYASCFVPAASRFSKVHFSKKNSSKYLKYTPKTAEQVLKELFLGEVITEQKN